MWHLFLFKKKNAKYTNLQLSKKERDCKRHSKWRIRSEKARKQEGIEKGLPSPVFGQNWYINTATTMWPVQETLRWNSQCSACVSTLAIFLGAKGNPLISILDHVSILTKALDFKGSASHLYPSPRKLHSMLQELNSRNYCNQSNKGIRELPRCIWVCCHYEV